jgi:iron complex outermembrane receptor protein
VNTAQFKGDDFVEYAGGYGPAGELPRLKGSVSTTWQKGAWSTTGRVNYTGGWFYGDNGECGVATSNTAYYQNFPDCKISAWTTVDLGLAYLGIKNLTLAGTVRNIFNNKAPYDPDNVGLGFNDSFHNPYGRYLSLRAEYKFF